MPELKASKIPVKLFNLKHTFESGCPLTFFGDYNTKENSLLFSAGKKLINVGQYGTDLMVVSSDIKYATGETVKRFRLFDNLDGIYKKINTDKHVAGSINKYRGLRLTLNDPWETTVCFIASQFNNVKRIRLIVKNLVARYGESIDGNGRKAFPTSEALMKANIKDLIKCNMGFRAKYLKSAAEYCTNNMDLYKLNPNKYDKLKETLLELHGVGDKVADCIALMGYGNLNAFPIDVHIRRAMENLYFNGKKTKVGEIHKFAEENWGSCRGYVNQYLFHSARRNNF